MSALIRFRSISWFWLLLGVLIVTAVLAMYARHTLGGMHDPGFSTQVEDVAPVPRPAGKQVVSADGQFMTLDPTGKFLINSITKRPVFLTGDSAWSLITQLSDEDVDIYLAARASLGFNFIWCAAADNYYQSNPPKNFYGDSPFDGPDFTNEDTRYWAHVDSVVKRAAGYGITVALDPAFVGLVPTGGYLASYQNSSESVLAAYGEFLGRRYKSAPNVIWALGGDVDPDSGVLPKLDALAKGIRSQDSLHLIVAEGQPQHTSLDTFKNAEWLDLNWLYFHMTNIPFGAASSYVRSDWMPSFLGEAEYENTPPQTERELREQGYWAVLSGAYLGNAGFGNSPMWYFNGGPNARPEQPNWKSQLRSTGSVGQMYFGRLFRSREHWMLQPDRNHTVMTAGYDSRTFLSSTFESVRSLVRRTPYRLGSESAVAARTADGQTIIAYIPTGSSATIRIAMNQIVDSESTARCWWFSPRSGSSTAIGTFPASGSHKFKAPDEKDWVLVVDSVTANLPAPGTIRNPQ